MSVNLKVTLGTVNYTDWLHVTASKVSSPAVTVWETWIDVPVTNYNFVIPGLDPENYYVRYYDAPTNSALGTLVAELIVNALTGNTLYERRFYTCGGAGPYDPADGDSTITDPYLINKIVYGTFKEGFRFFQPDVEYTFDDTNGRVSVINGTTFSTGEKFVVDIKYDVPNSSSSGGRLYDGTINVPEATRTLLNTEKNARVRCVGTGVTQVITLCALASLAVDDGFYFDNSCGGTAVQVKLLLPGADRIRFNGFNAASDLFAEFWVSRGEHFLLRKFDDSYWEVITDYKGTNVGERIAAGYIAHANTIPEDGSQVDGNQYGRLWWWINNVLPSTHWISDDSGTQVPARIGQFIIKPTAKKILMPNAQAVSEKGLAYFNAYGADSANRPYDYPGGFQDEMLQQHGHDISTSNSDPTDSDGADPVRATIPGTVNTRGEAGASKTIGLTGGIEQRIKNIGVIYLRRI